MKIKVILLSVIAAIIMTACTFVSPQITKSLYWRGKPTIEFFERYRFPDVSLECMKDNTFRHIYGYSVRLFEYSDSFLGQDATTIYMQRDKVYTGREWTIVFADEKDNITSIGTLEWGDVEKEYGCGQYAENKADFIAKDLSKRPVKERQWRAYSMDDGSDSTAVYVSGLHRSEEAAKADAVKRCQKTGAKGCVAWQWFSNVCLSTAVGIKDSKELAYMGTSLSAQHADYMAIKQCEKVGATQCKVFNKAACATPCDVSKDKNCMFDQPQMGIHNMFPTSPVDLSTE